MANLKVSYKVIDDAIFQLDRIASHPEEIKRSLGQLRQKFSVSSSACANELVAAIDQYDQTMSLFMNLAINASDMLEKAKIMYGDMDETMARDIE